MATASLAEERRLLYKAITSSEFARKYKTPFMKQLVEKHHARRISSSMIAYEFVVYLRTVHKKKVSTRLNDMLSSSTYSTIMFNMYKYHCAKYLLKQNDNIDITSVSAWSLSCLKTVRSFRKKMGNDLVEFRYHEVASMSSNDYVKHLNYKLVRSQYDVFKSKCIKEGTWLKWKIVKHNNTYYVGEP